MKFISQFCQFFYIVSISVHGRRLSKRAQAPKSADDTPTSPISQDAKSDNSPAVEEEGFKLTIPFENEEKTSTATPLANAKELAPLMQVLEAARIRTNTSIEKYEALKRKTDENAARDAKKPKNDIDRDESVEEDGVLKQFEKSGPWNALTRANDADVHKLKLAFKKLALAKILYHQKQPEIQFRTNNIYGVISENLAPNYVDHLPRYTNSLLHDSMMEMNGKVNKYYGMLLLPSGFTSLIKKAAQLRNDNQNEYRNIEGSIYEYRNIAIYEIIETKKAQIDKLVYRAKFLFLKELKTSIFEAFDETFEAKKRLFDRVEAFWNRKFSDFQYRNRVWVTWNYHGGRFPQDFHFANFREDLGEMKELMKAHLERTD